MLATFNPSPKADGEPMPPGLSARTATRMALGLLLLGLLWRTVRYLLQFPIWGDEAMLGLNFAWFDYAQLTQRLENCQIAPILFLWGERAAFCWLGLGELSMRLLPFLAGISSLALYWRLTGLVLNPRARLFAVGYLAVAIWPVSMSTLVKPYSFDLLMSLVLLVPAAHWLQAPERTRWLTLLTAVTPVALLGSYPAVFVAAGISLTLLRPVWQEGWPSRCWFAAYNLAVVAAFLLAYQVGNNHLNTPAGNVDTRAGMAFYWANGFPPSSPLAFPGWFALLTTGQMAAYPIGAANGGSTLTVLLCLAGAVYWGRRGRSAWLLLFTAPLVLNLVAAVVHRYPYGASCRLSQHLAPGFCILAGLGLATLIDRASGLPERRRQGTVAVAGLFALVGLGGLFLDVVHPYREAGCAWTRAAMRQIHAQVPAADRVVVCADMRGVNPVCVWYLLTEGDRVSWNYQLPPRALAGGQLWGFHQGSGAEAACERLTEELQRCDPAWRLVKRVPYAYEPRQRNEAPEHCELFCFGRSPKAQAWARGN